MLGLLQMATKIEGILVFIFKLAFCILEKMTSRFLKGPKSQHVLVQVLQRPEAGTILTLYPVTLAWRWSSKQGGPRFNPQNGQVMLHVFAPALRK